MSMHPDQSIGQMDFRKYTGEPNRRADLEAFGLVVPGHVGVKAATIQIAGKEVVIGVSPFAFRDNQTGDVETWLYPIKRDFRKAVRQLVEGGLSLRPLY